MRCRALLAGAAVALWLAPAAGAGEIQWLTSYDEARKVAEKSGKLIMLDFYGDH